jgi:enoyl-CoA hydratase
MARSVEISDGVATLTLNCRGMNALSELRRSFGRCLARRTTLCVVILTGAGEKAFTAGVDLKEMETAPLTPEELGPDSPINRAFRVLGKPTIAAVNGFAITAAGIAINCDILVASRTPASRTRTRASASFRLGHVADPAAADRARARYMSYTGNFVDAATASWGWSLTCCRR